MRRFKKSLIWLRRDLRIEDNIALTQAAIESDEIALCFIFDTSITNKLQDKDDCRISFILDSINDINSALLKKKSHLLCRVGDPTIEIPKLVKKLKVDALFFNKDFETYAKKRDGQVRKSLKDGHVAVFDFCDHVIFSGKDILKKDGTPYQVFTPYKNAWLSKFQKSLCKTSQAKVSFINSSELPYFKELLTPKNLNLPFEYIKHHIGGRKEAIKRLNHFSAYIKNYQKNRDFPYEENSTSMISSDLRFGTLSIRECIRLATESNSEGSSTWLSELIWREFYSMILDHYPHVEKTTFKRQYGNIQWPNSSKFFKAWKEGRTGFPIVDAGMRQLNATGWMHNRLRMITASFLIKDLLIDYKKGEAYFAEKLLDFDLASNNGGWQWCSSTGCDAQPYFRIFNPSLQSKRFDPDAQYIKTWVPELAEVSPKEIHAPETSELYKKVDYPEPIITHKHQKEKILALYKIKS